MVITATLSLSRGLQGDVWVSLGASPTPGTARELNSSSASVSMGSPSSSPGGAVYSPRAWMVTVQGCLPAVSWSIL